MVHHPATRSAEDWFIQSEVLETAHALPSLLTSKWIMISSKDTFQSTRLLANLATQTEGNVDCSIYNQKHLYKQSANDDHAIHPLRTGTSRTSHLWSHWPTYQFPVSTLKIDPLICHFHFPCRAWKFFLVCSRNWCLRPTEPGASEVEVATGSESWDYLESAVKKQCHI